MNEWEIILRLLAGTLCGMVLGIDRDLRGKQAGLRTLGLVGLGASVVAVAATSDPFLNRHPDALSRIIQGIIPGVLTGVGFIGAGVVLRDAKTQEVYGLTTAAAVWLTAALGIAAGLGAWRAMVTGAVVGIVLLAVLQKVEAWLGIRPSETAGDARSPAGENERK